MKKKNFFQNKIAVYIALALIFFAYGFRLLHLDQDLPPWGITHYQPKDEGCYALLAINEWEYGSVNPDNPLSTATSEPMYIQEHIRVNIVGNLLEIASFHIFGDNYYGLRMPMLLIGLLNMLLLFRTLLLLRRDYGNGTIQELWFIAGILLLVSFHFYFYVSSRTVEPSTLRMLFAQLTMLLWLRFRKRPGYCFFLMGCCVTVSVFFVYISNIFLYLAVGILLLMLWRKEGTKSFLGCTALFAIGTMATLCIAEIYYYRLWGCSAFQNFFAAIGGFSSTSGYEIASGGALLMMRSFIKGAVKYFSAYWFLYAPALIFLFAAILPEILRRIVNRDMTLTLMLAVPVSMLLQTMFSEDYVWRKLLVVAPYYIYIIYWALLCPQDVISFYSASGKPPQHTGKGHGIRLSGILKALYIAAAGVFTVLMVLFHVRITNDPSKADFTNSDIRAILILGCFPVAICGIYWIVAMCRKRSVFTPGVCIVLVVSTLALNAVFLIRYVFAEPAFSEKNAMISLSEDYTLDGRYITGDCCMGITLYNDIKHVPMSFEQYASCMISDPEVLMLQYEEAGNPDMRYYLDNILFAEYRDYTAEQIYLVPCEFQVYGWSRNFALYQAVLRTD